MSELPSYTEMAAEKLKERSKASGGELRNFVSYPHGNLEAREDLLGCHFYSCFETLCRYLLFIRCTYQ